MITLTELINVGEPFPRKKPVVFKSEYDLIKKYGLTLDEIEAGLKKHALVRKKFILDLSHMFLTEIPHDALFAGYTADKIRTAIIDSMREQAVNDIIADYVEGLPHEEIAKMLGITNAASRQLLSRATKKLKETSGASLFEALTRLNTLKNRSGNYRITMRQKITIRIDD